MWDKYLFFLGQVERLTSNNLFSFDVWYAGASTCL